MGTATCRNGRGILTVPLKRKLFALGMVLFIPAVLLAQDAAAGLSSPAEAPETERIDETTLLLGDDAADQSAPALSMSPFGIWDLLRMVLVLGAVIAVVYGIFYLLKRGSKGRFVQNDAIRVLGSQTLPNNRVMYLVEVGSQVFLVGAGSDSVNLIAEITDRETVDEIVLRGGEGSAGTKKSFSELITGMFKGNQSESAGFMKEQRERLQRLGRK